MSHNSNSNNNTESIPNRMPEPTISDVINLIGNIPNKDDFAEMQTKLLAITEENKTKINNVERKVESVSVTAAENREKIASLEYTIQTLQQDKLRNNVCISGVPIDAETDVADIVIKIANVLQITLRPIDFTAYATTNNKFIIVNFNNYTHKQLLRSRIRAKKSLMVEEVLGATRSNSQIYINEHLTQYFNHLYLLARTAAKQGKIKSAMSTGGKIRVRKNEDSVPVLITNELQLQSIIEMETDETNVSLQEPQHGQLNENQRNKPGNTAGGGKSDHKRKNRFSPSTSNNRESKQRKKESKSTTRK